MYEVMSPNLKHTIILTDVCLYNLDLYVTQRFVHVTDTREKSNIYS